MTSYMLGPAEFVASLLEWFDSKEKATLVVAIMVVMCAAALGPLTWKHLRFVGALRRATKSANAAASETGVSAADRLNKAGAGIERNPVVGEAWRTYRASLRDDPTQPGGYVNLTEASAWFAFERLRGKGYEKWAGTWAGVFLTLGLLFTFVGLSAALLKVGNSASDAEQLRHAVNGILSVSSAKFITSIAGIIFFIFWTLVARILTSSQHSATDRFARAVARLSTTVTPEVLLFDQLLAAKEQTDRMKTLADDVAVAFEARLSSVIGSRLDALPGRMGEQMQPVIEAINGMGGSLTSGADQAISRVAERLEEAASSIQAAQGSFGSSGARFGDSISQAATTVTDTVARMVESIDGRMAGLEARITGVDAALSRGAQAMAGVSDGMSASVSAALGEALRSITEQAGVAAEQARQQSQAALQPLLEGLSELAGQIRREAKEGGGHLAEGSRSAGEAMSTASAAMADRLARASAEAGAGIERAAAALVGRVEAAASQLLAVERAVAGHVGHLQRAGDTMASAGSAFGAASDHLLQAAEPVRATVAEIAEAARHAAESARQASGAQEALTTAARALSDTSGQAATAFRSYDQRFATTDEALGRTFDKLVGGVQNLSRELTDALDKMNAQLSNALGTLSTAVEEIGQALAAAREREPEPAFAVSGSTRRI